MSMPLGAKHTPEARAKMSASGKGRVVSEETRRKISIARKGHPVSDSTREKLLGPHNPRWRGGVSIIDGYRRITITPGKRRFEHRHIVEQQLGRKLRSDEHVHHIDGDKLNNNLSNLRVMSGAEHSYEHLLLLKSEIETLRRIVIEKDAIISNLMNQKKA